MTELRDRLTQHLLHLIRERNCYLGTEGLFYVRHYLREQLGQWGTVETHDFHSQGYHHQNLILNLPGTQTTAPSILVGAHYDAVPGSPGADDNASGVAVLLEMARCFSTNPSCYPIRLVAFDFEETQYESAGSTHYARSLQGQPLRLMLSLEMLGYCSQVPGSQQYPPGLSYFFPDRGNFIGLIGNLAALKDLMAMSRSIQASGIPCAWLPAGQRGLILPMTRRSDHAAFWDMGYKALMVSDTSFLRNPHYHKPSDRLETLDLSFLTGVCQGLVLAVAGLS
jgi:Zn-dependent M28 family amino/carboxypeptidase